MLVKEDSPLGMGLIHHVKNASVSQFPWHMHHLIKGAHRVGTVTARSTTECTFLISQTATN